MAELATIARPYADALFKAVAALDSVGVAAQITELALIAENAEVLRFAGNPKIVVDQVFAVITGVAKSPLTDGVKNLLRTVIENGRLMAMPEIAKQFQALVSARSGVSEATVYSAFPIDGGGLADISQTLEKRFQRKLNLKLELDPGLIAGIRVVVGDEVLDTSVKARLEQMKVSLTA
jgi:F-type H+-transporting ATPase subunit delta